MKTSTMVPQVLAFLLALSLLHSTSAAFAQSDPKVAAREHFEKGVAAFDDKRFGEAADEFEAAYRLSPAFVVLYNIGEVNVALGRSVEAVDAFDKYLKEGASAISRARKNEVLREIEKQLARIGTVTVRTNPAAAEVRVDGVLVGKTPLPRPVRLTAGRHTVEAILADHATQIREIDVVGRAELALDLTLEVVATSAAVIEPQVRSVEPLPPSGAPHTDQPTVQAIPSASPPPPPVSVNVERPEVDKRALSREKPSTSEMSWQRIGGVVVILAGIATATLGGVDVYQGANQANAASSLLSMDSQTNNQSKYAKDLPTFEAAKNLNQRGWEIAGVGAAVLVGGIILVAITPAKSNAVNLASWVTTESGGVVVRGAW